MTPGKADGATTTAGPQTAPPPAGRASSPATASPPPSAECPALPQASPAAPQTASAWTAVGIPTLLADVVRGSVPVAPSTSPQVRESPLTVFVFRRGTTAILGVYRGMLTPSGSFHASSANRMCSRDQVDALHQGNVEALLVWNENRGTELSPLLALDVLAGPALPA